MILRNGNFEADWSEEQGHRCVVISADGSISEKDVDNIFVPPGWVAWFYHDPQDNPGDGYDQPEMKDAWASHDPVRVHSGNKAIIWFTFYRRHDGGLFQQVAVPAGAQLRLTAYAHAWSNSKDGPHADDGRWSEGPGYQPGFCLEGDAPDDDWRNFAFYVGIDPTGGTNPLADSVVWGTGAHIYNEYALVPPVVATAEGDTVTVFLRSRTAWPFKHNDAYLDDAKLEVVAKAPQYQSTILVLTQDATPAQLAEILEAGYPNRRTFGFSHDDAGNLAQVTGGTVVLYNIPQSKRQDYVNYYAARYPNASLAWDFTSDWSEPTQPTKWQKYLLWQCNPIWANQGIGREGCTGTVCSDGCYLTNLAMTQRIYGIKADATPVTVHQSLGQNGYASWAPCRPLWAAIEAELDITVTSAGDLDAHLASGKVAMIEVKPTELEHFVLAVEKEGSDYLVLDPWRNEVALLSKRYAGIESFRLLSKVEPSLPPTGRELVSVHIQGNSSAAADYIQRVKPGVVKLVMGMERAQWVKSVSPDTLVVYRQWVRNQGEFWEDPDPHRGARRFLETFLDSLHTNAEYVDYVETLNETIATGDTAGIQRTAAFDAAFCEALREEGFPARPIVLTAAVGNPQHGDEVKLMLPAVRACVAAGGAAGPHSYWGARSDGYCSMSDAWQHFAGRALESWDPVFRAAGLYPHYLFGEGGAVYISGGHMPSAEAGWGYKETLNGDAQKYVAQILEFRRRLMEWNRNHGNRVLGATLFTAGGGQDWHHFELTANVLGPLADAVV